MNSDLLIKCLIVFCIVVIVCNLIYSSKLCNKDLVEGQKGICSWSGSGSGSASGCSEFVEEEECVGNCIWTVIEDPAPAPPSPPDNTDNIKSTIKYINENIFNKPVKGILSSMIKKYRRVSLTARYQCQNQLMPPLLLINLGIMKMH